MKPIYESQPMHDEIIREAMRKNFERFDSIYANGANRGKLKLITSPKYAIIRTVQLLPPRLAAWVFKLINFVWIRRKQKFIARLLDKENDVKNPIAMVRDLIEGSFADRTNFYCTLMQLESAHGNDLFNAT